MNKLNRIFALAMLIGLTGLAIAQEPGAGKTININFEDKTQEGAVFTMSLPVTFLKTFKPHIAEALRSVDYKGHDIDLAEIWKAVKDAGPMEYAEITNEEANVKVFTTKSHLVVNVHEKREGQKIDVTVPLALGDALFNENGEIDYDRIIEALLELEGQDLVVINSDKMNGRVWIGN